MFSNLFLWLQQYVRDKGVVPQSNSKHLIHVTKYLLLCHDSTVACSASSGSIQQGVSQQIISEPAKLHPPDKFWQKTRGSQELVLETF